MDILSHMAVYGWIIPSYSEIRTWLQTSMEIITGRIEEVLLLGRGIFMLKLAQPEDVKEFFCCHRPCPATVGPGLHGGRLRFQTRSSAPPSYSLLSGSPLPSA